jgi:hypothetical protein
MTRRCGGSGDRLSLQIETGGQAIVKIWSVHIVLNVFLAGPDNFHWPMTCFAIATAFATKSTSS